MNILDSIAMALLAFIVSCLIVELLGFLTGLDRARWGKKETERKLKAILELYKEKTMNRDKQIPSEVKYA